MRETGKLGLLTTLARVGTKLSSSVIEWREKDSTLPEVL